MSQIPFPYQPFALGHLTAVSQNIASISNANGAPIALTVTAHGFTVGTSIFIRVASVTGQTAINGDWNAVVTDANTLTIGAATGWPLGTQLLGTGVGSAAGTVVRTPLPITANHPELAGQGVSVQSIGAQVFTANSGVVYFGVVIPPSGAFAGAFLKRATFTDCLYLLKPTLLQPQSLPPLSPVNVNILNLDNFYVDFDTVGDGVLISAFQR